MFTIIKRRELNPTVTELCIHAPLIAKKAKAGQFIIVRAKEDSERIPLTIAGFDREAGTVSIIFQVVGAGTMQLNSLKEGEAVHDFVGPLGKATEIEGLKNVCVVGGGVGCAIALPIAQALHEQGTKAVSYTHLDVYKRQPAAHAEHAHLQKAEKQLPVNHCAPPFLSCSNCLLYTSRCV